MKLLLPFLLVVAIGAIWETRRSRPVRALPMVLLCSFVAVAYFTLARLV